MVAATWFDFHPSQFKIRSLLYSSTSSATEDLFPIYVVQQWASCYYLNGILVLLARGLQLSALPLQILGFLR